MVVHCSRQFPVLPLIIPHVSLWNSNLPPISSFCSKHCCCCTICVCVVFLKWPPCIWDEDTRQQVLILPRSPHDFHVSVWQSEFKCCRDGLLLAVSTYCCSCTYRWRFFACTRHCYRHFDFSVFFYLWPSSFIFSPLSLRSRSLIFLLFPDHVLRFSHCSTAMTTMINNNNNKTRVWWSP